MRPATSAASNRLVSKGKRRDSLPAVTDVLAGRVRASLHELVSLIDAVNPTLIPNIPFDTLKDLAPVMLVGTSPMAIVTHAAQPDRWTTESARGPSGR